MNRGEFIIGLDIGTTSTKGMLFHISGDVQDLYSESHRIRYHTEGRVEEDPDEVLHTVLKLVKTLVERNRIGSDSIICIVFGGILHSLIPVDRGGTPLTGAMIWTDTRSTPESEELRKVLASLR
jgi:gluconokinase